MSVTGNLLLLTTQVWCRQFSRCYTVNTDSICFWTDGSQLNQSAAQAACQQWSSSLPRITNSNIQSKLAEFRSAAGNVLGEGAVWIDVHTAGIDNFHWIDGSPLAG